MKGLFTRQYLGIDIGYDRIKLALCKGGAVKKAVSVPMPERLIRDGRIASPDTLGKLLRLALRENHIHVSRAAVVLSGESAYLRTCFMPVMTEDQLRVNIPYEFNDYITSEIRGYVFDFAVLRKPIKKEKEPKEKRKKGLFGRKREEKKVSVEDFALMVDEEEEAEEAENRTAEEESVEENEEDNKLELLVAAIPAEVLDELRFVLHRAGLKLRIAMPTECTLIELIRANLPRYRKKGVAVPEFCVLDLGYHSIRMYMFRGDRHMVTRELETGLRTLDEMLAESMGVDRHLAHTYLTTNYENCQSSEVCRGAYNNISIELQRALNFYRFSNPDSALADIWLCGGGTQIEPLLETISETLDMTVHNGSDLIPGGWSAADGASFVQAVGATMGSEE